MSFLRLTEWRFREKTENYTVYTFLYDALHLQLVHAGRYLFCFALSGEVMYFTRLQRLSISYIVIRVPGELLKCVWNAGETVNAASLFCRKRR